MLSLDMNEMTNIMRAINHYNELAHHFPQLDPVQTNALKTYYDKFVAHSRGGKYADENSLRYWKEVDVHMIKKTWGSTSCGWGGMGGAAMTSAYTLILENHWGNAAFIYWGGKLAYVCEMDQAYHDLKYNMPGLNNCSGLNIIYKYTR